MSYYVFRINYDEWYHQIREEILKGRLRQGWGAKGMDINQSLEEFQAAWVSKWGENDAMESYIRNKYNNISIMKEMDVGDILVVPKMNFTDVNDMRSFAVLRCSKKYDFSPLEFCNSDFGHYVEFDMSKSFCCSYEHDDNTRSIVKLFRAYQKSINRVWNTNFMNAVDKLIACYESDDKNQFHKNMTTIGAVCVASNNAKNKYLEEVVNIITSWQPKQLEKVTEELFVINGYEKIANNRYDKRGGDIDLVFSSFQPNTLVGDMFSISQNVDMPEIRVQLKNKKGVDDNDVEGVEQLVCMSGANESINILINTTLGYSPIAKEAAAEKGVLLINGIEFAELLLRYGILGYDD